MAYPCLLAVLFLSAVAAASPRRFEIAPGVFMPSVLLGTGYMPPTSCTPMPACQGSYINATAHRNVLAWINAGGTGIDTALFYQDQPAIAAAIAASGVPRSSLFLLTKVPGVGNYSTVTSWLESDYKQLGGPLDVVISHWCNGQDCTTKNIQVRDGGLEPALRVSASCRFWVDGWCTRASSLFFSSSRRLPLTRAVSPQETWRALEDFHKAGKARAIGISNYCTSSIDDLLETATVTPHLHQVERCVLRCGRWAVRGASGVLHGACRVLHVAWRVFRVARAAITMDPWRLVRDAQ